MTDDHDVRLRRLLRQHLESLRRAGVTHLPRPSQRQEDTGGSVKVRDEPRSESVCDPPASQRRAAAASPPLFSETTSATAHAEKGPSSDMPAPHLSRAEREQQLADLAKGVSACLRCSELAETRTQTVFGVGNPEARIMFIGEAPGADEDRQGEPFVGRAGQLLDRIIAACKTSREEVYICNILKCRPPGNRNPFPQEARNCREYLDAQIELVDPEYIICLGAVAAQNLLDRTDSIGRMRGRFFNYGRAKVACTYHPSYLLRNPSAKKKVWEDMKFIFRDMGVELG